MKNLIILASILAVFTSDIYSQSSVELFIEGNYNFFNMSDIKKFQGEVLSELTSQGIPVAVTESYPAYYGFKAGFLYPLNADEKHTVRIGLFFNHMTTGGRVDYSDFTGELKVDQIVSAISLGGIVSVWLKDFEYFTLRTDLSAMLISSRFTNKFLFRIGEQQKEETAEFKSASVGLEPSLLCSRTFNWFTIGLSVSYLIDFPAELSAVNNSGSYVVHNDHSKVKTDWSGFKFGLIGGVEL